MIFFCPIIKRNLKQRNQEQFKRKQEQEDTDFPEIFRKELANENHSERNGEATGSSRTVCKGRDSEQAVNLR